MVLEDCAFVRVWSIFSGEWWVQTWIHVSKLEPSPSRVFFQTMLESVSFGECALFSPLPVVTWEGSPREGNGHPLQYSCLENPTDRGAWRATAHRVARESDMTERSNNNSYLTFSEGPYCCLEMSSPRRFSSFPPRSASRVPAVSKSSLKTGWSNRECPQCRDG